MSGALIFGGVHRTQAVLASESGTSGGAVYETGGGPATNDESGVRDGSGSGRHGGGGSNGSGSGSESYTE